MANILITGTSSGIGFATALELARASHKVFATMRSPEAAPALAEIAARERLPIEIRRLDVASDASVAACFQGIDAPIDVLINNAGFGAGGSVEELPMETFSEAINTNYLGAVRCIKAVLPRMRQARSGCIINISSVAGRVATSPFGPYTASKFALEAISEALAQEVKPFNIRVAVVQPGLHDTKMTRAIGDVPPSLYPQQRRWAAFFRVALATSAGPEATAAVIRQVIESGTTQLRHASGPEATALFGWRAAMSDEQWIECSAQDDEGWYRQIQADFGMDTRPASSHE